MIQIQIQLTRRYVISHNVYYVKNRMRWEALREICSTRGEPSSQICPVPAEVSTAIRLAGLAQNPSMAWRCLSMSYAVWLTASVQLPLSLSRRSTSRLVLVPASIWSASSAWLDPVGQRSQDLHGSSSGGCNRSAAATATQGVGAPAHDAPCRSPLILVFRHLNERVCHLTTPLAAITGLIGFLQLVPAFNK